MPYTEEDRLTTENNLLNLLQCLENNGLKIDNESRNLCARELSDRHDYAIFYQKLGQYADIVIDKFDHYQIRPNILTCQLDIDALVAIIHNKGKITIAPTENLPIENIISLYQGQSWFKTCNIEAIKDHADMKEHNIIKKTIEHTIFVFVGHHNLKYEFANLLAKQLSKRLHSYVIFETYDSMTCSSHIEIRNSRIDLEDFQRKLQTTPDEQIFAITHDKGLIHILDSENDYIPQLVEIRYNSLYRRSSDDPSLRLHSYVHLVSPSLNPPSKDSAAGRKSNIQNSSHAASTVNPNVYPHPQAFSHATYAADDTYETYDPHANVPYPYPYSYPQGKLYETNKLHHDLHVEVDNEL